MKTIDPQRDWRTLLACLPEDYEALALEHRVLNTQWPGVRVDNAATLLRFILLHVGADLALRQTVATIAKSGGPKVTQVWLHKKMRRAQPYLAALVQRLVGASGSQAVPERWAGYEVMCLDGSTVSGPGAEGADARMHAVLRLHDLRICDVHVTSDSEGETLRRFMWQPGQLVIVDRGYANPAGVGWVVDHKADVLVRVNRGSLPLYDETGTPIDVLDWCRQLPGHRSGERLAEVHHHGPTGTARKRCVGGRLVAVRLPDKEAEAARERVHREHGAKTNAEQLEAAAYVILFTTAPAARLSAARCVEAYRLRWQIELQWKRWKSLCHFDHLPNYRDDTILSWLTAKVLLGVVLDRIGSATLATPASETSRPAARQPWKVTAILWPMMVSALMPIRLADAAQHLPGIADLLDEMDTANREHQVSAFRDRYYPTDDNHYDCAMTAQTN